MRRQAVATVLLAVLLVFGAWPAARAEFLGSDVIENVSPESRLGGQGLADRYPLSAYGLDSQVDVGLTNPDGVAPMIAHWAAAQLWSFTSFLVTATIDLFTWAFSLDLLTGGTGGSGGALAPVADAITSVYENVIGEAWIVAAILLAGLWGIWKALVQRRYTETAGALGLSVLFVLIALFFVYQPERTIGEASRWTNTLSLAFLSGANRGSLDDPEQAKGQVADHLFKTLVHEPWVVLQFGGLRHCVDIDQVNDDGYPRPVGPHDSARDVCRNHLRAEGGRGGYAERFLRQPAGSKERKAEYEALRSGEAPSGERQFAGFRVDKTDSPAVDIQQAGGAFQRLTVAAMVFLGALGGVALLGFLGLAVILAQVVALVLLGFAPVALVIGIFPGAGHAFFRSWLAKLATAVFIKALYSLVIAIVVAVSAALTASTGSLGFLLAFGLQSVFFWAIFVYRRQITARLVAATTGGAVHHERLPRLAAVQRGAEAAARPFTALVGVGRRGEPGRDGRQESALAGTDELPRENYETPDAGDNPATPAPSAPVAATLAGEPSEHKHGSSAASSSAVRLQPVAGDPLHVARSSRARALAAEDPSGEHHRGGSVAVAGAEGHADAGAEGLPRRARVREVRRELRVRPSEAHQTPETFGGSAPRVGGQDGPSDGLTPENGAHEDVARVDVMRRARELREQQRTQRTAGEEPKT